MATTSPTTSPATITSVLRIRFVTANVEQIPST